MLDDEPEGSYHGYACGDYYRIDPRFGSNELYREFVGKAHDHGLKVIMDIAVKRKAKMGIFPGPGKQKTGYLAETPCRTPDNLATFATTKLP